MPASSANTIRHDWRHGEIAELFVLPFNDLLFRAHSVHREHFDANRMQVSTLLSIKTGGCPEDCKYCPQSVRYDAGLTREALMEVQDVISAAKRARDAGASRFCMGAAWRSPKTRDFPVLLEMVRSVKALGLETCMTLGMLSAEQADMLARAGLDYYNHNLDTSPEFYGAVVTTRVYKDRIDTLENVRRAGMKVCCGGILGLGESVDDRIGLLQQLANLPQHPESVPINQLVRIRGTPYADNEPVDPIDFVRCVAVARILMPASWVRLSAGREAMSEELQALAFFAGANSIFYGEKLLTTPNPEVCQDRALLAKLGMRVCQADGDRGDESTIQGGGLDKPYYDATGSIVSEPGARLSG